MRLDDQRASGNVEDRRGMRTVVGGPGIGGIVIVLAAYFHGSSEQRVRWFKRGLDSGQPKDCCPRCLNSNVTRRDRCLT